MKKSQLELPIAMYNLESKMHTTNTIATESAWIGSRMSNRNEVFGVSHASLPGKDVSDSNLTKNRTEKGSSTWSVWKPGHGKNIRWVWKKRISLWL